MVSFLTSRIIEVLVIDSFYVGILMRFAQRKVFVGIIYGFCTDSNKVNIVTYRITLIRLTAAVYASAGTCHDLNHMEFLFSILNGC